MQIGSDPNGARRHIMASIEAAAPEHRVQVFRGYGGSVEWVSGTYRARACRITATCTASEALAVKAWACKAKAIDEEELK